MIICPVMGDECQRVKAEQLDKALKLACTFITLNGTCPHGNDGYYEWDARCLEGECEECWEKYLLQEASR